MFQAATSDTSTDSAFDSLLTSASKLSQSSFSRSSVPIFYQDESDDEVTLAPPKKVHCISDTLFMVYKRFWILKTRGIPYYFLIFDSFYPLFFHQK